MFLIIKLMLIILLNQMFAHITQDIETTILPARKPTRKNEISLTLKAFGKQIQLNLCRNDKAIPSAFKVWLHDAKGKTKEQQLNSSNSCYYHHNDHMSSALINFCQEYGWEGLVFLEDNTLEIKPLPNDFASLTLTDNSCVKEETNISFGKLHLIKRSLQLFANSSFNSINLDNSKLKRQVQNTQNTLTIELAVFFDEAAYNKFMPILNQDKEKLRNMILAYVNNIQALFHHSSFGASIDISLVHLQIMDKQPSNLPVLNADNIKLWNSFCTYANTYNLPSDNDPGHWDLALYLTGLDIYRIIDGFVLFGPLGTSVRDSICTTESCAIVEFGAGTTSSFASSVIAAHEIGHILGMPHDEDLLPVPCKGDYIMSKHRKMRGQITWSKCSRNVAEELWDEKQCLRDRTTPESVDHHLPEYDHSRYHDLPGREWNAKAQCEIYFHNKNANVVSLLDMCQTLQCEMPKQKNAFTGPALEGTYCDIYIDRFGHKKECRGGECVPITQPPYISKYHGTDNWSEWKIDSCKSDCLKNSTGVVVKRRFCTHGTNKSSNCKGPYYDVVLCDDSLLCANKSRQTVFEFSETKCTEFSLLVKDKSFFPFEILKEPGVQAHYDVKRPWIACVIFCRRKYTHYDYYAPCLEMMEANIDPYYPDGTWCHYEDGQNYYCRQHYCLPYLEVSQEIICERDL